MSRIFWSHPSDSNRRPADYESAALPAELGWLSFCFSLLRGSVAVPRMSRGSARALKALYAHSVTENGAAEQGHHISNRLFTYQGYTKSSRGSREGTEPAIGGLFCQCQASGALAGSTTITGSTTSIENDTTSAHADAPRREKTVRCVSDVVADSGVGLEDRGRRRGDRRTPNAPPSPKRTRLSRESQQVILRARQWADWAAFFRDGMLQEIGAEMQDFQPTSVYHSANL